MNRTKSERIALVGVPLDLGANRRGVEMGPSGLRVTNLVQRIRQLGYDVIDKGDIDAPLPEECEIGDPHQKYAEDIRKVCEDLCDRVEQCLQEQRLPVVMGGDHSLAMGSIAGVSRFYRNQKKTLGLIWFDAHGDMNTPESTESGNVHGMPLAHILGMGDPRLAGIGGFQPKIPNGNAVLVGVRDLDDDEKNIIVRSGVTVFTMKDIDTRSIPVVVEEAIAIASKGTAGIHVSFDVDVMDPTVAPGVGTPKRGGLIYRESHLCMEILADSRKVTSVDMVEVNPILDTRNATAEVAAELILSVLGKRIF